MLTSAARWRKFTLCAVFAPVLALTSVAACGDDDDDNVNVSGRAGASGRGGSGGTGNQNGSGGSGDQNGAAGSNQGGAAGSNQSGAAGSNQSGAAGAAGTAGSNQGGSAGVGGAGGQFVPPPPTVITDGGVVAVMSKANQGEIDQGKLAAGKATNASVKAFAEQMVNEHEEAQTKLTALSIAAEDNPFSRLLATQSQLMLGQLNALPAGAAFDRQYMTNQVLQHEGVLSLIDVTLLPSADAEGLNDYLETVRVDVAQHLQEAQDILDALPVP
jgi:putative membrane protein